MWFWIFLASFSINIIFLFYIRWLLKILATINEDIVNLETVIIDFKNHIKAIYEMEMFYGDDTLKSLLSHASELSEKLEDIDLVLNSQQTEEEYDKEEESEKKEK